MSDGRRIQRVEKELQEIVANFIIRHFTADLLSVTQIRVTKDLRGAKVYVSAIGKPKVSDSKLEELQEQAHEMQREISKKLHMRYCPKLEFVNDQAVASAQKIDEILTKIKN
jgi:ribosome-binding factor A